MFSIRIVLLNTDGAGGEMCALASFSPLVTELAVLGVDLCLYKIYVLKL